MFHLNSICVYLCLSRSLVKLIVKLDDALENRSPKTQNRVPKMTGPLFNEATSYIKDHVFIGCIVNIVIRKLVIVLIKIVDGVIICLPSFLV